MLYFCTRSWQVPTGHQHQRTHGWSCGFFAPVTACPARVSLRFPVSRLTSAEPGVVPGSIIVFAGCSWATTESLSVCHLCQFEVRLPQGHRRRLDTIRQLRRLCAPICGLRLLLSPL